MAKLPTPEENARTVLKLFEERRVRAGEVIMLQHIQGAIADGRLTAEDAQSGLAYGGDLGWFDNGPNATIVLTQAGFEAM